MNTLSPELVDEITKNMRVELITSIVWDIIIVVVVLYFVVRGMRLLRRFVEATEKFCETSQIKLKALFKSKSIDSWFHLKNGLN